MTTEKVFKLTAQEDITYRVGASFPKEGFPLAAGQSIRIVQRGLQLIQLRKACGKGRGLHTVMELR